MKLKSEKAEKLCKYCENSTEVALSGDMLCAKKGVVSPDYKCRKFVYDPFKRTPRIQKPIEELEFVPLDD